MTTSNGSLRLRRGAKGLHPGPGRHPALRPGHSRSPQAIVCIKSAQGGFVVNEQNAERSGRAVFFSFGSFHGF